MLGDICQQVLPPSRKIVTKTVIKTYFLVNTLLEHTLLFFNVFSLDDDYRVVLQEIDGLPIPETDYINASFIDVSGGRILS